MTASSPAPTDPCDPSGPWPSTIDAALTATARRRTGDVAAIAVAAADGDAAACTGATIRRPARDRPGPGIAPSFGHRPRRARTPLAATEGGR